MRFVIGSLLTLLKRFLTSVTVWRLMSAMVLASILFTLTFTLLFPPPSARVASDACALMQERPGWWRALRASEKQWGISPSVQLAVIRAESDFRRFVHPSRLPPPFVRFVRERYKWADKRFGWSLNEAWNWPVLRTAYGYPQAIDATWARYKAQTGRSWATRIRFRDATDFVGWYLDDHADRFGVSRTNACDLYLTYYTGRADLRCDGADADDRQFAPLGRRVSQYADGYTAQLAACETTLKAASTMWPAHLFSYFDVTR